MKKSSKILLILVLTYLMVVVFSSVAFAAGTGMPWEGILQKIADSLSGLTAKLICLLIVIANGVGYAIAPDDTWLKKVLGIILPFSIIASASTFVLPLLGFGGGVAF